MRIEITRQLHPLERERYEFVVRVEPHGIHIDFNSYVGERRESIRHRIYKPFALYHPNPWYQREWPNKRVDKPKVPLEVAAELEKKFERALRYEFTVVPT